MKKILFVDLSVFRGGAEVSLENIISSASKKHSCTIMKHKSLNLRLDYDIVKTADAPFSRGDLIKGKKGFYAYKVLCSLLIRGALYTERDFDIILSNTFKAHIFCLGMRLFGSRKAGWVIAERDMPENMIVRILKMALHSFSDYVVFPSRAAMNEYSPKRGTVIPNIVNIAEKEGGGRDYRTFLYAGGKTYKKGADRAYEVFSGIKKSFPDAKLFSAGGVPDYEKGMFCEGGQDGVIELGYVDLAEYYRASSFLLFFSRRKESFSRICAEAMAAGCIPCILKGSGTDDYAVDGYNALVFDNFNAAQAAGRISGLLQRYDEIRRISFNAEKTAMESFAAESVEKKWAEIWGTGGDDSPPVLGEL